MRVPPFKELQWGGQAGGPLIRDRLFVSASFEKLRTRTRQSPLTFVVPSPGAVALTQPGSIARQLLTAFPTPATSRGNGLVSFATMEPTVSLDRLLGLGRADYSALSGRLRLMGRLSLSRPSQPDFIWYPYQQFDSKLTQPSWSLALDAVATVSPRWINDTRVGFSRDDLDWNRPHPEIPSLSVADVAPDGSFQPVLLPGSPASYEYRNAGTTEEWNDSLTFAGGRHLLKMGAGVLARSMSGYLSFARDGLYEFSGFGAFLVFNQPDSLRIAVDRAALPAIQTPSYNRDYSYRQYQGFVQDTYRVAQGLTLDFGLRYENFGSPSVTGATKDFTVQLGSGNSFAARLARASLVLPAAGSQMLYHASNAVLPRALASAIRRAEPQPRSFARPTDCSTTARSITCGKTIAITT